MMQKCNALTLKSDKGALRVLRTPCGVSTAFNPQIGGNFPPVENFIGLWDTGASGTVISKNVVDKLGLVPTGKATVNHANGQSSVNVYLINIILMEKVAVHSVAATEGVLKDFDVLIGMNIITLGDFSITNVNGKTKFSFRIPSIKEVDFVEEQKKNNKPDHLQTHASKKINRNDPCPCESGKPYRKCCGLLPKK